MLGEASAGLISAQAHRYYGGNGVDREVGASSVWRLAFFLALTCAARADELVGKRVPPFPDGMYEGGGSCIAIGTQDPCHGGVGVLMSAAGKEKGVYASISDGHDEEGHPFWIVTDVIPYPRVNKGYHLDWGSCRYDGVEDSAVIAVVKHSKQSWLRAADWAYRVENASGKLIKLDPKRVDCYNTALEAD